VVQSQVPARSGELRRASSAAAGGPVPRGFVGASLSFVSVDEGWVLGTAPCAHRPCTVLLRTLDGGARWRGVPAPVAPLDVQSTQAAAVSTIRFADARHGFAFDPGLWVTGDGASHWHRVRVLAGLRRFLVLSLEPTRDGTVYALVARATPGDGPSGPLMLLRAALHASAFTLVGELPPEGTGAGSQDLVSAGAGVYVASGSRLLSFGPVGRHSRPLPSKATPCELASSNAQALLAICGEGVASGSMGDREAFGTTDGGAHWTRLPDPGKGDGYDTEGVAETTTGHAVIATISGAASGLLATVDGGRRWQLALSYRSSGASGFADLGFENDLNGSVIYQPAVYGASAHGILLRTSDGGRSWHHVPYR